MKTLFINEAPMEKLATLHLDRDSTTWVKSIITEFLTQYPQLQNQLIGVQWKKKDPNKGYAVGSINIMGGSVPIIINNYKVAPFDVMMFGQISIPLTAETLGELLTNNAAFRGATHVKPKTGMELFGDARLQFSPTDRVGMSGENEGITRDAIKVGSFIERIEHIDKEAVQAIFNEVKTNSLLTSFEVNGTSEVLEKLANSKYSSKETELESYLRNLEIDRQFVFEDENGNKFVKQANSKVDYTWTTPITEEEAVINLYNSPNFMKTDTDVKKITLKELKKGEKGRFSDTVGEAVKSAEFEILDVKLHTNLTKTAYFEGIGGNFGLFVDNKGNYCNISAETAKKASFTTELEGVEPQIGDYGTFVIDNKVTKPFTVIGIQKNAEYYEVKGQNLEGVTNYYPIRVKSSSLWPKDGEKWAFFVPNNAYFIKLGKHIENTPEMDKLAHSSSNTNAIEIVVVENLMPKSYYIHDGDSDFNKGLVSKTATFEALNESSVETSFTPLHTFRRNGLDEFINISMNKLASLNDTLWNLIHQGANESDINKIANLRIGQEYVITNVLQAPTALKEIESAVEAEYEKLAEVSNVTKLLVKEAAVLKDKTTVDAVLSLGLMKKHNILEYIQLIPDYERVVGELAKLLIMVRLGLANVSEVAVKTAMEALTTTVTLLKQLQKVSK